MTTVFHKSLAKTDNDFPRRGLTFVAATACLICTFIAAAIAIPMMAEWRSGLSLSESEMAMTVAVSYTHLTLPRLVECRSRWSPDH